jgi:hypothetical protein
MSLKSRKSIDQAGPDVHAEVSVAWMRNPDKTYTKITKITHRDRKTGSVKPMKLLKPTSVGPFKVVDSPEEADDQFEYLGMDEKPAYVYLKLLPDDSETQA